MTFHVTSLHGVTYEDQFDMAILKSSDGEYAILDNHLPIIDHIHIGFIELRSSEQRQFIYLIDATMNFHEHRLEIVSSDAQIGKTVEQAKSILEETKAARLQLAKAENIDFSKLEKDLFDFIQQAKSGRIS
jgi:F-type H+-transporting ATPase subunit epsilon